MKFPSTSLCYKISGLFSNTPATNIYLNGFTSFPTTGKCRQFFSKGSTKDDVIFAEGTPKAVDVDFTLHQEIWYYASGSVMFQHNVVVSYINNGGMHVQQWIHIIPANFYTSFV